MAKISNTFKIKTGEDRNDPRPFLYVNRTVPQSFPLLFCPSSLRSGCICLSSCWFVRGLLGLRLAKQGICQTQGEGIFAKGENPFGCQKSTSF